MGLDLDIFSISGKADFVLKKAISNIQYAIDFDKILYPETLEMHLKMIQSNPDGAHEHILKELIADSHTVISYYPEKNITNYVFSSLTRGYETLNYLLDQYFKEKNKADLSELFYSGISIENESQWSRFQYIDQFKTKEIQELLEPIEFDDLLKYYDFEKMKNSVYKLITPEKLPYLEEEFNAVKKFYNESKKLEAFVLVKIS